MRTFFALSLVLLLDQTAFAATLDVEVDRHGFTGPIQVAVAPRVEGRPPEWSATVMLTPGTSAVSFGDLAEGLYIVLAGGPQPLQRLSAKVNLGTDGRTLRLVLPREKAMLRTTLSGTPLANAHIAFTHGELRWRTELDTDADGRFTGELWEPAVYGASVTRDRASAPHSVDVALSSTPLTIDVPDRHVSGRVLDGGKPLAAAIVNLRSEIGGSTLTMRTVTGADGRFEFFGVREGALALTASASSYLDSDAATFELHGAPSYRVVDVELIHGEAKPVRVVDAHDTPIAGASLMAACDGNVKSKSTTNGEGRAEVALPRDATCVIYVLPKEGSIAVATVKGAAPLLIRVAEGSSSLHLALKSTAGQPFPEMNLLMRIDGVVVSPAIARLLSRRGFALVTNDEGQLALEHIPAGTYEFWPYRTTAEGQMIYETATEFAAPISVQVRNGENDATIRFQAR